MAASLARRTVQLYVAKSARNYSSHGDPAQIDQAYKMWKNLTLFAVPVALGVAGLNVFLSHEEEEKPEFIAYEHLRIRTKRYPWGDGQHSFFHNPHVNALPDGYEE